MTTFDARLSRRRLLQATGLAAGSMFMPSLSRAQATDGPPKRLVIFFSELGFVRSEFEMRRPGLPADEAQDWEFALGDVPEAAFSKVLRPMYRHRHDLIALENLSAPTALMDQHGDAHAQGFCAALTGHPARSTDGFTSHATRASIDQIIADALRAQDASLTDLTALTFAPSAGGSAPGEFGHWPFYREGPGERAQKVPAEDRPENAFSRLFPTTTGPDAITRGQSHVLDVVRGQYAAIRDRLSMADRQKLSAHHDMIADIERRLAGAQSCMPPEIGTQPPITTWSESWPGIYQWRTGAFLDMMAVSMGCGMSRVLSFNFKVQPAAMFGRTGDVHHDYSHPSAPGWTPDGVHDHAEAVAYMSDKMRWEVEQIAAFADTLKSMPEAGGSVFDNTVIYYMNEISHGGHGHTGYTGLILGSGGGALNTGRYLYSGNRFPRPLAQWAPKTPVGAPVNHVLNSLAQVMGVDVPIGARRVTGYVHDRQYTLDLQQRMSRLHT